jgi:flavin reductase
VVFSVIGVGAPAQERFAAVVWSTLERGAPVLADCALAFDCRIANVITVGTHDVLFSRVMALQISDRTDNLICFGRAYYSVRA